MARRHEPPEVQAYRARIADPAWRARRGPAGRPLCGWCEGEVPPRRGSWCSDVCVQAYKLAAWGPVARRAVFKRDHGVCSLCQLDTQVIRYRWAAWRKERPWSSGLAIPPWVEALTDPVRRALLAGRHLWENDHTVPLVQGGSGKLENQRTLCITCHQAATAQLAADLAFWR